MLLDFFSDEVTVYSHQGYDGGQDDFWQQDMGWELNGTIHEVLIEDEPSEETQNRGGFADEAESAIYARSEIAQQGDKIEVYGREYVVVSTSPFHTNGDMHRQLIGIRGIDT
ncbi:MAG: hypothetical protein ABEH81_01050 [Halopenitus sp.]